MCNVMWKINVYSTSTFQISHSKLVNKQKKRIHDVCNQEWGTQMKLFSSVLIHYLIREEKQIFMLIAQFPINIFSPLFKQVKYWDKKKSVKWNDWLYMRNFSNHDIIMDSNMMEDMMEWWKLDKLRQHTELCMSECLKSEQQQQKKEISY